MENKLIKIIEYLIPYIVLIVLFSCSFLLLISKHDRCVELYGESFVHYSGGVRLGTMLTSPNLVLINGDSYCLNKNTGEIRQYR